MDSIYLVLFLSIISVTHGMEFPNKIVGRPTITCNNGMITINVQTSDPTKPPSRVFAKGYHDDENCRFKNTFNATFTLGGCSMHRKRMISPRGIEYSLIIVVQMHPLFITKVDRAYDVQCFYMEADKLVTQGLDVSMITTDSTLSDGSDMPTCIYSLHKDSAEGPIAKYSNVGDQVWHVWSCPSESYGMLVHSCYARDGAGNTALVLDERGCGLDQYVMKTPEYDADVTRAFQETHVFKFADRMNVDFECQIRLCMKADGGCEGITLWQTANNPSQPPVCNGRAELFDEIASNSTDIPIEAIRSDTKPTTEPELTTEAVNNEISEALTLDELLLTTEPSVELATSQSAVEGSGFGDEANETQSTVAGGRLLADLPLPRIFDDVLAASRHFVETDVNSNMLVLDDDRFDFFAEPRIAPQRNLDDRQVDEKGWIFSNDDQSISTSKPDSNMVLNGNYKAVCLSPVGFSLVILLLVTLLLCSAVFSICAFRHRHDGTLLRDLIARGRRHMEIPSPMVRSNSIASSSTDASSASKWHRWADPAKRADLRLAF